MKITIMQPYFYPYAGYFRLFSECDQFVFLDCVQFPRRGWVHRNQLSNDAGEKAWLTLPLLKGERDTTRIQDLRFPPDAREVLLRQFSRFPALRFLERDHPALYEELCDVGEDVTEYLIRTLVRATVRLGIDRPYIRSSSLGIPSHLKAQERILAIAKAVGATEYLNLPGGVDLYDPAEFAGAGLRLHFLPPYNGSYVSMLERLIRDEPDRVREEIEANCGRLTP